MKNTGTLKITTPTEVRLARKSQAKKFEGATAVRLAAPSKLSRKVSHLPIPSGGATAVRLVAPFKRNRKGFELCSSSSRRNRR